MVLTANGTIEQLKSHLGNVSSDQASFDRIWEMTEGKALAIDGESYRRRK
jgi:DNA replication protein DnaC